MDQAFVDFDSVRYHLSTPVKKTQLLLSMDLPCWAELVQYGAHEVMQREYGDYLTDTEHDYAVSLLIDLDNVPALGRQSPPCHPPPHSARTDARADVQRLATS